MKISNVSLNAVRAKADLLVVASFLNSLPKASLNSLEPVALGTMNQAVQKGRFSGKDGETFSIYGDHLNVANELVLIGLGKKENWTREKLRQKIAGILTLGKMRNARSVRILAETFVGKSVGAAELAESIPETLLLAEYRFEKYQTMGKGAKKQGVQAVEILYSNKVRGAVLEKALKRAQVVAESVIFTRNLINEPANVMSPREVAVQARRIAREGKLRCEVLGPAQVKQKGMGGIVGVSQGSKEPPQLIVLEYGSAYKRRGTICLVGKGVTFDSGGISIKPSGGMEKMKYDMSGAAAVLGTMKGVSRLKPKLHVVSITPCVENMPSGGAQRPGDIVKMFNGKSVEVINTDAEGRLILADALAYTERFKPKAVIDLATLTGACVVALSDKAIGLLGTDQALVDKIRRAGEATGERCWQLPLWAEYFEQIKGHHSDILNVGGGGGGTITAAMFTGRLTRAADFIHKRLIGSQKPDGLI